MRDWDQAQVAQELYNEIIGLLDEGGDMEIADGDDGLAVQLQKADVRFNLGGVLREGGDHVAAVAEYNAGLAALAVYADTKEPGDDEEGDGVGQKEGSELDETIAERVKGSQAQLLMARGLSTAKLGDSSQDADAGLSDIDQSLVLVPRAATWNCRGNILKSAERPEEAMESYEQVCI